MKAEFSDAAGETVGQRIGGYKTLECVGEGGSGVVFNPSCVIFTQKVPGPRSKLRVSASGVPIWADFRTNSEIHPDGTLDAPWYFQTFCETTRPD